MNSKQKKPLIPECMILSEKILSKDWNSPKENKAWEYLSGNKGQVHKPDQKYADRSESAATKKNPPKTNTAIRNLRVIPVFSLSDEEIARMLAYGNKE